MRVTRFCYRHVRISTSAYTRRSLFCTVCCNRLSSRCGVIFCADKNAFVRNNIVKEPFSSRQEKMVPETDILEIGCVSILEIDCINALKLLQQLQMQQELHHVYLTSFQCPSAWQ